MNVHTSRIPLFFSSSRKQALKFPICLLSAVGLHIAIALYFHQFSRSPRMDKWIPIELETLTLPAPPQEKPKPEESPPEPPPPPADKAPSKPLPVQPPAPVKAKPPPSSAPKETSSADSPASAPAVLTQDESAQNNDEGEEVFRFVSDPTGNAFHSGFVKRGGVGRGTRAEGTGTGTAKTASPKPARSLARSVQLDETNPCQGAFPSEASASNGTSSMLVMVSPKGSVISATILRESPKGQGFGQSARTCLLGKRFTPALNAKGQPIRSAATVHIEFSRR